MLTAHWLTSDIPYWGYLNIQWLVLVVISYCNNINAWQNSKWWSTKTNSKQPTAVTHNCKPSETALHVKDTFHWQVRYQLTWECQPLTESTHINNAWYALHSAQHHSFTTCNILNYWHYCCCYGDAIRKRKGKSTQKRDLETVILDIGQQYLSRGGEKMFWMCFSFKCSVSVLEMF